MNSETSDIRRALPAVDRLLDEPEFQRLIALYGRELVRLRLRQQLDEVRAALEEDPGVGAEGLDRLLSGLSTRVGADLAVQIFEVPRDGGAGDQEVVNVAEDLGHITEDGGHVTLESLARINSRTSSSVLLRLAAFTEVR